MLVRVIPDYTTKESLLLVLEDLKGFRDGTQPSAKQALSYFPSLLVAASVEVKINPINPNSLPKYYFNK